MWCLPPLRTWACSSEGPRARSYGGKTDHRGKRGEESPSNAAKSPSDPKSRSVHEKIAALEFPKFTGQWHAGLARKISRPSNPLLPRAFACAVAAMCNEHGNGFSQRNRTESHSRWLESESSRPCENTIWDLLLTAPACICMPYQVHESSRTAFQNYPCIWFSPLQECFAAGLLQSARSIRIVYAPRTRHGHGTRVSW